MANQLITAAEWGQSALTYLFKILHEQEARRSSGLFIEDQMNWERPEFDEHG